MPMRRGIIAGERDLDGATRGRTRRGRRVRLGAPGRFWRRQLVEQQQLVVHVREERDDMPPSRDGQRRNDHRRGNVATRTSFPRGHRGPLPVASESSSPYFVAVVLSWNGREATLRCLESLRGIETVCVDNGSTDGTAEAVATAHPDVDLILTGANLGYAAGNNVGIRRALERGADWVLVLNHDVVVDEGLTGALAAAARARPDAGVLACKVLFAHDPERIEYAGAEFNALLGYSGRQTSYGQVDRGGDALRDVGRATGAAMAVSRRAIEQAGLLDERLFMYVEDTEWCLRIRAAGAGVVFVPEARVWHSGGSDGRFGRTSATAFYYHARNTLAVAERHRPLPRGLRGGRRLVIVGTHLVQVRRDRDTVRAVLAGWRDYRAGRMGRREHA